jgi:AraC-like DNA-binding protein
VQTHRFSTVALAANIPNAKRAGLWADALAKTGAVGSSNFILDDRYLFQSTIESVSLDGMTATRSVGSPLQLQRTRHLVRTLPSNEFVLVISTTERTIEIEQFGRRVLLQQGEAALLATQYASTCSTNEPGCALSIVLPRDRLTIAVRHPEDWAAVKIGKDNSALQLVSGYADLVLDRAGQMEDVVARQSCQHISELAVAALATSATQSSNADSPSVRAAHRARINKALAAHFANPDFRIDQLAQTVNLSPRYIQLLLAEVEDSFSDCLRRFRLENARREICGSPDKSIADIAFDNGFSDLSTFNRGFQRAFGMTPRDLR